MRVEKTLYENGAEKWILVDDDFQIIEETLQFTNYLYARGYSPNTVEGYLHDIKTFLTFTKSKGLSFLSVLPYHIPEYVWHLVNYGEQYNSERIRANTTINRMIAGVASCYRYHEKVLKTIEKSPFTGAKALRPGDMGKGLLYHAQANKAMVDKGLFYRRVPKKRVKRLTTSQVSTAYEGFESKRNKLIFKVLYNTGLRIGELLGLRINDYSSSDPDEIGSIFVVARASNKQHQRQKTGNRVVHVPMSLIYEIDEYVVHDRPYLKGIEHIFVSDKGSQRGRPLSRKAVEKVFHHCSKKIGIPFTPHVLRHTHFSELAEFGYDEAFLQARGGWAKINSASTYLHLSPEAQRKAFERFWEASNVFKL